MRGAASGMFIGKKIKIGAGLLALALSAPGHASTSAAACDRACLEGFVDRYMTALAAHDPRQASLAAHARYTENGQELRFGDGLWGTITGLGSYKVYITEPEAGQVGFFGTIRESGAPVVFALRLRVQDGQVTEAESFIPRGNSNFPTDGTPAAIQQEERGPRPTLTQLVPAGQRLSREALVGIADGYFESMEQGTSRLAPYSERCTRIENGNISAGNPAPDPRGRGNMRMLHCAQQFDTGFSKGFSVVPMRRYPVVDRERGIVFAVAALQHTGLHKTMRVKQADGSVEERPASPAFTVPFQFTMAEIFKVEEGKLHDVEAVLLTVPYGMPSGWDRESMTDAALMHGVTAGR